MGCQKKNPKLFRCGLPERILTSITLGERRSPNCSSRGSLLHMLSLCKHLAVGTRLWYVQLCEVAPRIHTQSTFVTHEPLPERLCAACATANHILLSV